MKLTIRKSIAYLHNHNQLPFQQTGATLERISCSDFPCILIEPCVYKFQYNYALQLEREPDPVIINNRAQMAYCLLCHCVVMSPIELFNKDLHFPPIVK